MKKLMTVLFLLPLIVLAQQDSIMSGPYNWQQPVIQKNKITSIVLLQGKAHDFEWMQLNANSIDGTKEIKQNIPANQEQLIIIKSGAVNIHLGDTVFLLTPNSVAVLMPGEKYSITNTGNAHCDFYTMKYRSKNVAAKELPAGKSFVRLWENISFKPNTIGGGRKDFFECGTVLQKRFEMHVSTLKEGIRSHEPHTHKAEEIVLLVEGDTEMQIGRRFEKVSAGGFYFLGSNVLHAIKNMGTQPATYFAIQFE